jgi:hypothetical protein
MSLRREVSNIMSGVEATVGGVYLFSLGSFSISAMSHPQVILRLRMAVSPVLYPAVPM